MAHLYNKHNNKDWPHFTWDADRLVPHLSAARYKQGLLLGKMQDLGYQLKSEATLAALTEETVKSSIASSPRAWLAGSRAPKDRRVRIVALTPRGKDLIVSAFRKHSG